MMEPPPAGSILAAAACAVQNAPLRLVPITWSHCSGPMSAAGLRSLIPALAMSTSSAPISANAASTCARSLTSHGITSGPGVRATTTTSQPSSRNRCTVAAPMPLVPPVTTTRLPARLPIVALLLVPATAVRHCLYPIRMSELRTPFIGVVSDTHGYYDSRLDDLLAGAERIIHAGDIGTLDVLSRLKALAPVTAVLGNTDLPSWEDDLPWETEVEALGLRILLCHIGKSLMGRHDPVAEGYDLVVSGHSHKAAVEWREQHAVPQPRRGRQGHGSASRARSHWSPSAPTAGRRRRSCRWTCRTCAERARRGRGCGQRFLTASYAASARRRASPWSTIGAGYVSPSVTPAAARASGVALHGACACSAGRPASSGAQRRT